MGGRALPHATRYVLGKLAKFVNRLCKRRGREFEERIWFECCRTARHAFQVLGCILKNAIARGRSDKENARIEHDRAFARVIIALMKDDTELFKQFSDNPSFKRWLSDTVFAETYQPPPGR